MAHYLISSFNIRPVTPQDLDVLVELSRSTFDESYRHLNDPADFDAYMQRAFDPDQLLSELSAPDTRFFFAEQALPDGATELLGYIKLNLNRPPQSAHGARLDDPQISDNPADWTELERIYIRQSAQGQGIGAGLMQTARAVARDTGCQYLWLGVWEINHSAIAFYHKEGFRNFGTHIFDIGNDPQTDLMMICDC